MGYQAKPAKDQPKHVNVLGIHVNNQFGTEQLDTVKEEDLCLPSEKEDLGIAASLGVSVGEEEEEDEEDEEEDV